MELTNKDLGNNLGAKGASTSPDEANWFADEAIKALSVIPAVPPTPAGDMAGKDDAAFVERMAAQEPIDGDFTPDFMHLEMGEFNRVIRLAREGARREPVAGDGIYIASKTKHASRWRHLRDVLGVPINSTWIDEAGEGESTDLADLWRRCIAEASSAKAVIVYREEDDVLKGGWIELGAALASGVPVYAVGIEGFTIANHVGLKHFASMEEAVNAALANERCSIPAIPSAASPDVAGSGSEPVAWQWRYRTGPWSDEWNTVGVEPGPRGDREVRPLYARPVL